MEICIFPDAESLKKVWPGAPQKAIESFTGCTAEVMTPALREVFNKGVSHFYDYDCDESGAHCTSPGATKGTTDCWAGPGAPANGPTEPYSCAEGWEARLTHPVKMYEVKNRPPYMEYKCCKAIPGAKDEAVAPMEALARVWDNEYPNWRCFYEKGVDIEGCQGVFGYPVRWDDEKCHHGLSSWSKACAEGCKLPQCKGGPDGRCDCEDGFCWQQTGLGPEWADGWQCVKRTPAYPYCGFSGDLSTSWTKVLPFSIAPFSLHA